MAGPAPAYCRMTFSISRARLIRSAPAARSALASAVCMPSKYRPLRMPRGAPPLAP